MFSKSSLFSPGDPTASLMPRQAKKKNRWNILAFMVEPFSRSIKSLSKKTPTCDTPKQTAMIPTLGKIPDGPTCDMAAPTTKARNVMQWFRKKSTVKASREVLDDSPEMTASRRTEYPSSSPASRVEIRNADLSRSHPAQDASFSFSKARCMFSSSSSPKDVLRIHHGAVDRTTITTRPPQVIKHVYPMLEGISIAVDAAGRSNLDDQVDRRGLPVPSNSSSAGGMLKGLLMRRQSSQVSGVAPSQASLDNDIGATASSPVDSPQHPHSPHCR
ncbi:hypothetical protein EDB19DRAFT_1959446 [Suillus lakei]|nr:hypothetical protein EDB19DRAFT_1959446 [Suillus lakei]